MVIYGHVEGPVGCPASRSASQAEEWFGFRKRKFRKLTKLSNESIEMAAVKGSKQFTMVVRRSRPVLEIVVAVLALVAVGILVAASHRYGKESGMGLKVAVVSEGDFLQKQLNDSVVMIRRLSQENADLKLGEEVKVGTGRVRFPEFVKRLDEVGFGGEFIIEREISGEQQRRDILETIGYLKEIIGEEQTQ